MKKIIVFKASSSALAKLQPAIVKDNISFQFNPINSIDNEKTSNNAD